MENHIITMKIRYNVSSDKDKIRILKYIKNYNNVLRFTYNRMQDGKRKHKDVTALQNSMNNIFIDSWFKESAYINVKMIQKDKIIFGGKKLFFNRLKGKISKEEFKLKKLLPLYSVGEAKQGTGANRKFKIIDENTIIFKPTRAEHIELNLVSHGNNYKNKLKKLIKYQNDKLIPITYSLDLDYIYISFDNSVVDSCKYNTIKNRVIGIDLNPNYLGYSIVDWYSEDKYQIIDKGVFDISPLNNKERALHVSSDDSRKKYFKNKRDYEIFQITHDLFNKCRHYKCNVVVIEDLSIAPKDLQKGKSLNRLINNQWNRNKFIECIKKLVYGSSSMLVEVKPQYSSVLGNLIYRSEKLPDMILSSIEIGRRGYEFASQYLLNIKSKQKNIIFPDFEKVKEKIALSLEEIGKSQTGASLSDLSHFNSYEELFSGLKKSKLKYRFLLEQCKNSRVFSVFHYKSLIKLYKFE